MASINGGNAAQCGEEHGFDGIYCPGLSSQGSILQHSDQPTATLGDLPKCVRISWPMPRRTMSPSFPTKGAGVDCIKVISGTSRRFGKCIRQ